MTYTYTIGRYLRKVYEQITEINPYIAMDREGFISLMYSKYLVSRGIKPVHGLMQEYPHGVVGREAWLERQYVSHSNLGRELANLKESFGYE